MTEEQPKRKPKKDWSRKDWQQYRADKTARIGKLPQEVKLHRARIIRFKSQIRSVEDDIRGARHEIIRMAADMDPRDGKFIQRSIVGAIAIHQSDRGAAKKSARSIQLAYGFIRGRPYVEIEQKAYTAPDWDKVLAALKEVCGDDPIVLQKFAQWKDEARKRPITIRRRRLKPAVMPVPGNGMANAKLSEVFRGSPPQEPPTAA